jgi:hypothetical protein
MTGRAIGAELMAAANTAVRIFLRRDPVRRSAVPRVLARRSPWRRSGPPNSPELFHCAGIIHLLREKSATVVPRADTHRFTAIRQRRCIALRRRKYGY